MIGPATLTFLGLILFAFLIWLATKYIPMQPSHKVWIERGALVVIVLLIVLLILSLLGVGVGRVRLP